MASKWPKVVVGLLLLTLGISVVLLAQKPDGDEPKLEASLLFDPSDDHLLATNSTDIFVGRVVEKLNDHRAGVTTKDTKYMTQYSVEILQVVKGSASNTVTLSIGKFRGSNFQEARKPLKKGERALFITQENPTNGWYVAYGDYGHYTIHSDAEKTALIARFAAAAGLPIPGTSTPVADATSLATALPTKAIVPSATETAVPATATSAPTETRVAPETAQPTETLAPATKTPTVQATSTETPTLEPTMTETVTPTLVATDQPGATSTIEAADGESTN